MIKVLPDKAAVRKWSEKFRGWFYYPTHVISNDTHPEACFQCVDCPLVYQVEGNDLWHMFYTGYDGNGYQTMRASSYDLVGWKSEGLVMGYGKEGMFDYGGVTFGGVLFKSYDLNAPRLLKKLRGRYYALYGCYAKQGGYEIRPGYEGIAWSSDGFNWHREEDNKPVLSVDDAMDWEKDCIYQPWLLEYQNKFYNFYNAANGVYEQSGIAFSSDLRTWERYKENPVLRNGRKGSYDELFCSDPKVFFDEDHWVMFYFGVKTEGDIWKAHIMAAYSYDLINWTKDDEPLYKAGGNPNGLDSEYAHKISLVYNNRNDTYYMYYTAAGDKGRMIGLLTNKKL